MAKKQKSFADKTSGKGGDTDAVMVKYVKSVKSEKTGSWRFNEQMIKLRGGENLDAALKRMDEAANLVDIDLSNFESKQKESEDKVPESQEEASSEAESSAEVVAEVEAQSDSDSVGEEE